MSRFCQQRFSVVRASLQRDLHRSPAPNGLFRWRSAQHLHTKVKPPQNWSVSLHRRDASTSHIVPPTLPRRRTWRTLAILLASTSVALWVVDEYYNDHVLKRNLRTAWVGLCLAVDYKFFFDKDSIDSIEALHQRSADRMVWLCERNQGLYLKLAQAIAVQAAILPAPYRALSHMFDKCEEVPFDAVRKLVEEELQEPLEAVFSSFSAAPVAAASIAQVHHAILRSTGEEVAVKVQRPTIRAYAKWDLRAFRLLLVFYERVFGLPLSYFGQYISDQIEKETRFDIELMNSQRARKDIEEDSKLIRNTCYVPTMYPQHSSERLLVMEWIEGHCRMTDVERLEGMGVSTKEVARSVCEVFASQIFRNGHLQCDGHPGNILVRRHPNGKRGAHQVVLIDHGLYIEIPDSFRYEYAKLWRAIFEFDFATLERITTDWGMGKEMADFFASATLLRPWKGSQKRNGDEKKLKANEETKDSAALEKERKERSLQMQRDLKSKMQAFLVHVELLPKELIFIGRAMRISQANNQCLGSPVNRLNILARHASNALLDTRTSSLFRVFYPAMRAPEQPPSGQLSSRLTQYFSDRFAFLRFRATLFAIDIAFWTSNALRWVKDLTSKPGEALGLVRSSVKGKRGFEDDLEESMRALAHDELGVDLDEGAFV